MKIIMNQASRIGAFKLVVLLLTVIFAFQEVEAQSSVLGVPRYGTASYYRYAEPGDIPMTVHIWGYVFRPGLYEVPVGTKLSTILSLSGGFSLGARQWSQERTITLELSRSVLDGDPELAPLYQQSWVDSQIKLDEDLVLEDGSFIVIDAQTRRKFNWRDVVTIVGAAASLTIAIERVSSL